MKKIIQKAKTWLEPIYSAETRKEVKALLNKKDQNLINAFYQNLNFGTGGAREKMGVGTNRINVYTLTWLSQAVVNYLKIKSNQKNSPTISIVIAYDTRNNSKYFAEKIAEVFAKNSIKTYLFTEAKPTPLLSYAVRYLKCSLGVVITASHNPKEYNGFKVYNHFGGQIVEPTNIEILNEMKKIGNYKKVHTWLKNKTSSEKILYLKEEIERNYINSLEKCLTSLGGKKINALSGINVTYSPLHGNGIFLFPQVAKYFKLTKLNLIKEQSTPDGNFPTVLSPNPEERNALELGLKAIAKKKNQLLLLTDPDSDRLGVVIKDTAPTPFIPNGNEIGLLLVYYLINKVKQINLRPKENRVNYYILSTLVSSPLLLNIARKNKIKYYATLTGFKYLGAIMEAVEKKNFEKSKTKKKIIQKFLFAMEESYGYLFLDSIRDKDAISSAILFCQMYDYFSKKNISLKEVLKKIHLEYGLVESDLFTLLQEGREGKKIINKIMSRLREKPPPAIDQEELLEIKDYQKKISFNYKTKKIKSLRFGHPSTPSADLPTANFLQLFLKNKTIISIRPSGTEPKIKFYVSVEKKVNENNYKQSRGLALQKIKNIKNFFLHTYVNQNG